MTEYHVECIGLYSMLQSIMGSHILLIPTRELRERSVHVSTYNNFGWYIFTIKNHSQARSLKQVESGLVLKIFRPNLPRVTTFFWEKKVFLIKNVHFEDPCCVYMANISFVIICCKIKTREKFC